MPCQILRTGNDRYPRLHSAYKPSPLHPALVPYSALIRTSYSDFFLSFFGLVSKLDVQSTISTARKQVGEDTVHVEKIFNDTNSVKNDTERVLQFLNYAKVYFIFCNVYVYLYRISQVNHSLHDVTAVSMHAVFVSLCRRGADFLCGLLPVSLEGDCRENKDGQPSTCASL